MSRLTPQAKKRITSDWQSVFPELRIQKPMQLLRREGLVVVGICLDRDSGNDNYLPISHVHCLAGVARPESELTLALLTRLRTRRTAATDHITVRSHDQRWREAANRLEEQSRVPLRRSLSVTVLIELYDQYWRDEPVLSRGFGYLEDMVVLAACSGDADALAAAHAKAHAVMAEDPFASQRPWADLLAITLDDAEKLRTFANQAAVELGLEAN